MFLFPRTVEINNTDAEGRLVLADGVVYASKDLSADIILDMATLTGAQVGEKATLTLAIDGKSELNSFSPFARYRLKTLVRLYHSFSVNYASKGTRTNSNSKHSKGYRLCI